MSNRPPSLQPRIRVGVIGCGEHASENLLPSLWLMPSVEVVGLCDSSTTALEAALQQFPRAIAFHDFHSMIATGNVQAVVAAAPPQVHVEVASAAIEHGVHVFLEKPPAVTTEQLLRLATDAQIARVVTMVGHNLRHSDASHAMKSMTSEASFGCSESMEVRYYASKPRGDRWGLGSPLRSFLLSHVNHALDFMVCHVGGVASVEALGHLSARGGITLVARVAFERGGVGTLFASSDRPHFSVHATVLGSGGAHVVMESLQEVCAFGLDKERKRSGRIWIGRQLSSGYAHAGYLTQLELFVQAVCGAATATPSFADEVPVYELIDTIQQQLEPQFDRQRRATIAVAGRPATD